MQVARNNPKRNRGRKCKPRGQWLSVRVRKTVLNFYWYELCIPCSGRLAIGMCSQMVKTVPLTNMIRTRVYLHSGPEVGLIEELIVDPTSGIVRFASIRTEDDISVLMPWAAMIFTKSRGGFMLTAKGEFILESRRQG